MKKGKAQSRRNRRCGKEILWKRKISAIMGTEHLTMEREAGAYAHQLSTAMGHFERAWHEERGLAAVRRSDHQYDCQHGQGKAYQYGNTTAYLQSSKLRYFRCDQIGAKSEQRQ